MSVLCQKNICTGPEVEQTVPMRSAGSVSNMGSASLNATVRLIALRQREEIATSQTDTEASENEMKERTDMEILRELLERKKRLLSKCLGTPGIDKSDEHIRMQKLEVGALASMLCELEDLEEKKDRPKQTRASTAQEQ